MSCPNTMWNQWWLSYHIYCELQEVALDSEESMCEIKKEEEMREEECPAVVVEQVQCAELEQCYAAQVVVYDDETYLMQGVAEEQEVETEVLEISSGKRAPFSLLWGL